MSSFDWADTYDHACTVFHQAPRTADEQTVLEHFRNEPARVTAAIDEVAQALAAGQVRWGWSTLADRLNRHASRHLVVAPTQERGHAITAADHLIRNTGHQIPTEAELLTILFGDEQQTASLTDLQQLEQTTRDQPGRPLYDGLLRAAIGRTSNEGTRPVPTTPGLLAHHDTPELRQRLTQQWRARQPADNDIDWSTQ